MQNISELIRVKSLMLCVAICFKLLLSSELSAQYYCEGFDIQVNGYEYCAGDLLELSVVSNSDDIIDVFWYSEIFSNYELYGEEISYILPNNENYNGLVEIYVDVFFDDGYYLGCFEIVFIEVYNSITEAHVSFNSIDCTLCLTNSYTSAQYFYDDYQNETTPIEDCISLLGLEQEYFDVIMINYGAPSQSACATSTLTLENQCSLNAGLCAGITAEPSQTAYCTGSEVVINFSGDLSNLVEASIVSTDFSFENEFFDGQQLSADIVTNGYQCINGDYDLQIVTTCQNGESSFSVIPIEIYSSYDTNLLFVDNFSCSIYYENYNFYCNYYGDFAINAISGFSFWDGSSGQIEATVTGDHEFVLEFVNLLAPPDLECSTQLYTGSIFCEVCDEASVEMSSDTVCPGDTVLFNLTGTTGFVDVFLPDGQFLFANIESSVATELEWVVGAIPTECSSEFFFDVFFNCEYGNGGSTLQQSVTVLSGVEEQYFYSYEDCSVCIGSICPEDEMSIEWDYPAGLGVLENGDCLIFSETIASPTVISALVSDSRDVSHCFEEILLEDQVPCSGCPPMYAKFEEEMVFCPGDWIDLSADFSGVSPSYYKIEWLLDGTLIESDDNLFQTFEILECIEQHELVLKTTCLATDFTVSIDTIDLTFYNQLGAQVFVEDCHVELIPDCELVDVFWSEGFESADGTVYVPEPNTSGEVTFVLVSTEEIFSCNQAIFEVEYSCTDVGIVETKEPFDFQVSWSGGQMQIFTQSEIREVLIYAIDGKEVPVNYSAGSDEINFRLDSLPMGVYLVAVTNQAGERSTQKIQL